MAYVTVTPGHPGDLKHGYTLADIDRITRSAASHAGHYAADYRELVDLAWTGAVTHLYQAEHPPPEHDLWHAGRNAIWQEIRSDRRFHGAPTTDRDAGHGTMPSFRRFWWDYSAVVPSPEPKVVEYTALAQIWPKLTELQRGAILALAAHGTIEQAAEAVGVTVAALRSRLQKARARFLELWHEGETPTAKWRPDMPLRDGKQQLRPCGTASAYARHRRRGETVDDACRQAWTAYLAERTAARQAA